jgi:hypothetical protein
MEGQCAGRMAEASVGGELQLLAVHGGFSG